MTSAANVRATALHAFVGDDSHCEVVGSEAVVLPAHDFRGHVPGSSRRFTCVFGCKKPGNPEIGKSEIALVVKNKIFWLDISVDDLGLMHRFERVDEAGDEKSGDLFAEFAFAGDVVPEVTAEQDVHDEVEVHFVLEGKVDIDNKLGADEGKQLELPHHTLDTLLSDDARLGHLLHGELVALLFLEVHPPNLTESSPSNRV